MHRQELDNYAPSWGFRSPAEQPSQEEGTPLPSIISRKVGAGSTIQQAQQQLHNSRLYDHVPARVIQQQQEQSGLWNDTAAAQRAFRKEAQRRRVQQKEFHAKQSTRQRQQEYDQAVKARLAQGSDSSPVTAHRRRHTDSNVPIVASQFRSDLPHIVPAVSGSTSTLQGPRAKRLQAIARQPRPPTELVRPPRQMSRIPDDVFLPDIASSLPGRAANTVQLMGEQSPRLNRILSTENDDCAVDLPAVLLPQLSSQRSRRLTQELPRLGSQVSMAMA